MIITTSSLFIANDFAMRAVAAELLTRSGGPVPHSPTTVFTQAPLVPPTTHHFAQLCSSDNAAQLRSA